MSPPEEPFRSDYQLTSIGGDIRCWQQLRKGRFLVATNSN